MTDLTLLSRGEREVLEMLAQGHTAKSIAVAKGISVAAVNERLRAARRKTGIGSSRELARFVRLQKNRDEEIELPDDAGTVPSSLRPTTIGFGRRVFMPVFVIIALGAAYLTLHQNVPATPPAASMIAPSDPLLAEMDDPLITLAAMHRQVRRETAMRHGRPGRKISSANAMAASQISWQAEMTFVSSVQDHSVRLPRHCPRL